MSLPSSTRPQVSAAIIRISDERSSSRGISKDAWRLRVRDQSAKAMKAARRANATDATRNTNGGSAVQEPVLPARVRHSEPGEGGTQLWRPEQSGKGW